MRDVYMTAENLDTIHKLAVEQEILAAKAQVLYTYEGFALASSVSWHYFCLELNTDYSTPLYNKMSLNTLKILHNLEEIKREIKIKLSLRLLKRS